MSVSDSNKSVKIIDKINISGNEKYYAISQINKIDDGVLFLVRKKKMVYSLIMHGFYTKDHSLITDLIEPALINLENYRIKTGYNKTYT